MRQSCYACSCLERTTLVKHHLRESTESKSNCARRTVYIYIYILNVTGYMTQDPFPHSHQDGASLPCVQRRRVRCVLPLLLSSPWAPGTRGSVGRGGPSRSCPSCPGEPFCGRRASKTRANPDPCTRECLCEWTSGPWGQSLERSPRRCETLCQQGRRDKLEKGGIGDIIVQKKTSFRTHLQDERSMMHAQTQVLGRHG